jgi:uncharacterized protein YjbI with pentapeptide repeats
MDFIAILEDGRRDFLDALRDISAPQASAKRTPGCWSILECIEHVVTVEDRYLGWISQGAPIVAQRDPRKETRLFTTIRGRLIKVETPDVLRPQGRFASLAEALSAFAAVRDRSVTLARERGDALYSLVAKHPYFGNVNGAELLVLIDAHARRHADQIRDAGEAVTPPRAVRARRPAAKSSPVFKRDRPDLPDDLESPEGASRWFVDGERVALQEMRLQDVEGANLKVDTFRVEGSLLERVHLAAGQFGSAVWKDVRFVGCDLANLRVHRMVLVRVEFVDCRLTGFSATALDWQDVLIRNGDLRYCQLQAGKFRNCEFEGSNWQEADLQQTDLAGSVFRSCNLAHADLHGAKLQNTDLRNSEVEGMLVGVNDLKGAIVDPSQAMILARVLGLQIK